MDIGNKIRKIRELKGYSQDYMSQKLNISQRSYSKIEREEVGLNWERLKNIADILNVDAVDLIKFDDSLVFNNCNQSGKSNTINNHFSDELKEQYEKQINLLTDEIKFLREALNKRLK